MCDFEHWIRPVSERIKGVYDYPTRVRTSTTESGEFMKTTVSRLSSKWPAVALLTLITPLATEGQRRGSQQAAAASWPSITVGAKVGYDNNSKGEVLGAQLRVPLLRSGAVELMPSAEVTFLAGLKEYQYVVEALYLLAGRRGGPYVGGGLAFRNTLYGAILVGYRHDLTLAYYLYILV